MKYSFVHRFSIPIYGGTLYYFDDSDKFRRFVRTRTKDQSLTEEYMLGLAGLTVQAGNLHYIGVFDNDDSMLAHECVHAAANILLHAGVEISAENDEALAYLVGYIFNQCNKWRSAGKK